MDKMRFKPCLYQLTARGCRGGGAIRTEAGRLGRVDARMRVRPSLRAVQARVSE